MDTSGYKLADLDSTEIFWGKLQLEVDVVIRPVIDTLFSSITFDGSEMVGSVKSRILLDNEEDKGTSPPASPVSEKANRHPVLKRSRPFGTRIEIIPDYVYSKLFQQLLLGMEFDKKLNKMFHFSLIFLKKTNQIWCDKYRSSFDIITFTCRSYYLHFFCKYREKSGTPQQIQMSKPSGRTMQRLLIERGMLLPSGKQYCWL